LRRGLETLAWLGILFLVLPALAGDCPGLASLALPHTTITHAELVTGGTFTPTKGEPLAHLPPFCRVAATLKPSSDSDIRVEVWMPVAGWNERLEGTGNGGFAGNISYGALAEGVRRGYAVTNTDMGMATIPGENASMFVDRPERWADWGYRATHEMTLAAKQIVHAFYMREASHSYFVGCSTGGEQALMEAQRYPDDYEGIVGGAPAHNRTGVHESILWNFVMNERTPASYLPEAARKLLTQAVVKACDSLDGVQDGVITDPTQCHFDPSSLACKADSTESCLTAAQVETAKAIYAGPSNPRTGASLYPGLPPGSEFGWDGLDKTPGPAATPPYGPIFQWVFGLGWTWRQFDFDHQDATFQARLAGIVNATNPDLDTFRAHGHKLLMYHGWSDWLVAPGESIRYYDAVAERDQKIHAATALDQSLRLFMVPGMAHCGGGPGETHFDTLDAVVDWVEHGKAPNRIIATRLPLDEPTKTSDVSRPLCPYPQKAQYKGSGATSDAASFTCALPHTTGK
jgi:feruloyl esterase